MGKNIVEKIISKHLNKTSENNILYLNIDNTLTQDATGTMAYLELMSMGINRVKTEKSVSYIDHNTLQSGFENADDHLFLQSVASKYGVYFSKPGNGICHQIQLERFTKPGTTLLGSDSHTPTSGALGCIAIGAGGLDVALAMAGKPFKMIYPQIVNVVLHNNLRNGVSAKDIILEILRIKTTKGGANKIFEYSGDGLKSLSVTDRATICNMGAELGATTSIFPSDEVTQDYLRKQKRINDFIRIEADEDAVYDEKIEIDLSKLEPLIACPNQPDNIKKVSELKGLKINQICIGSCTNSSYSDMAKVASILRGNKVSKDTSLVLNPGSKQVLMMMIKNGLLFDIVQSGARILECTCGPCIGMGQSPSSNGITLRTYNRNFYGRSGTLSAQIYLVSPEIAAYSALKGELDVVPENFNLEFYKEPENYIIDDSLILAPTFEDKIIMGPNIMPLPKFNPLNPNLKAKVILKLDDNISTDHIMMAGSKVLPFRSNIEKLSDFCFSPIDPSFKKRALEAIDSFIIAGNNYGQGSSREHAAICPRYLGVKAVFAKSFARIHRQNLINFGILPVIIDNEFYETVKQNDVLTIDINDIFSNKERFDIKVFIDSLSFTFEMLLSKEEKEMIIKGSLLNTL